ncbi:phosphotransferase family protein [Ktedonospora formicarum]|uniref:Aminoglycoside phosphotransferase domain-containing protein n=1 Tax=Ktedonospora formicarum TaxID=2778364 RepID=A0A8J3HY08_9CHLR|nr:aminoglycoside phosphotransferase family protein [Ktedonospora formicarum]GHO43058.1 hypothetical protein KSX_12210 [Ktedonospora formicarum]
MLEQDWGRYHDFVELDRETLDTLICPAFPGHRVLTAELLSEGHCNTNYKLMLSDLKTPFVLRIYRRDQTSSQKDWDIYQLVHERVPMPRILYHDTSCKLLAYPYAIIAWADGILLRDAIAQGSEEEHKNYGYAVGATLAAIGSHTFPHAGFFGPGLNITEPFEGVGTYFEVLRQLIETGPTRERLGTELSTSLWSFIEEQQKSLEPLSTPPVLVHSDFKGINILVHRGEVSAILDWEFAFADTPLFDIANMLRYEHRMPPSFVSYFLKGYQEHGGNLPPDWHRRAKLLDLMSLCEFLHRPTSNQAVIQEVTELIQLTLTKYKQR